MNTEYLVLNDCADGQVVEAVINLLPQLDGILLLASVIL